MTNEQLKEIITTVEKHVGQILTSRQAGMVVSILEMGFDLESVLYALDVSVDMRGKNDFRYAEKALLHWYDNGCRNVSDIKAYRSAQDRKKTQEKTAGVVFKNTLHKQRCSEILGRMKSRDVYHAALAYLLALDDNIHGQRISECFDFSEDSIKSSVLDAAWITGTDRRVLQLGFNLWNDAQPANVSDVFGSGSDLEYMLEAVRIRFGAVNLILQPTVGR